jgi:hypothetical protein
MKNRLAAFLCKKEMPCMGYARKDVEKTKKLAKKFVRYQEGAELYSIGLTKFQEIVEGRKTGINFLSYENHNVNVEE